MVYTIPIMALSAVLMPLTLLMQRNVDHDLDQNILNIMWVNLSFQLAISLMCYQFNVTRMKIWIQEKEIY